MRNKLTILLAMLLLVIGCFSMTACKDDSSSTNNGEVSDAEWTEALSFNYEEANNFTISLITRPTYSEDKAAEYDNSFDYMAGQIKVDMVNQIAYTYVETRYYDPLQSKIISAIAERYLIKSEDNYFLIISGNVDGETIWHCNPSAEDEFNSFMEDYTLNLVSLNGYAATKSMFNYNEETSSYEIVAGSFKQSIKFLENNEVILTTQLSETSETVLGVSGINTTTISIPDKVSQALSDYKNNQN